MCLRVSQLVLQWWVYFAQHSVQHGPSPKWVTIVNKSAYATGGLKLYILYLLSNSKALLYKMISLV